MPSRWVWDLEKFGVACHAVLLSGGEKTCPYGNPYDCCPVPWHTQRQLKERIATTKIVR